MATHPEQPYTGGSHRRADAPRPEVQTILKDAASKVGFLPSLSGKLANAPAALDACLVVSTHACAAPEGAPV